MILSKKTRDKMAKAQRMRWKLIRAAKTLKKNNPTVEFIDEGIGTPTQPTVEVTVDREELAIVLRHLSSGLVSTSLPPRESVAFLSLMAAFAKTYL